MQLAWVWQAKSLEKFEATPLVVDGVMYTVQAPNDLVALDAATGRLVLSVLDRVNRETGTTMAIITHNAAIGRMGDTVLHMSSGEIVERTDNERREDVEQIAW